MQQCRSVLPDQGRGEVARMVREALHQAKNPNQPSAIGSAETGAGICAVRAAVQRLLSWAGVICLFEVEIYDTDSLGLHLKGWRSSCRPRRGYPWRNVYQARTDFFGTNSTPLTSTALTSTIDADR